MQQPPQISHIQQYCWNSYRSSSNKTFRHNCRKYKSQVSVTICHMWRNVTYKLQTKLGTSEQKKKNLTFFFCLSTRDVKETFDLSGLAEAEHIICNMQPRAGRIYEASFIPNAINVVDPQQWT